eukprot:gene15685-6975_t
MSSSNEKSLKNQRRMSKGVYCSAINCSNNPVSNPELSFHHFPSDRDRSPAKKPNILTSQPLKTCMMMTLKVLQTTMMTPFHCLLDHLVGLEDFGDGKSSGLVANSALEQKQAIRTAPKLTERHINPSGFMKMRVKLAAQIFSHSVAAGITLYASLGGLSKSAIGTAEFLERVDKIFDTCNSLSFKDAKKQRRPFSQASPHLKIMKDGIQLFKSLKVTNKSTKEDKTNKLKCLNGWLITLNSMISL